MVIDRYSTVVAMAVMALSTASATVFADDFDSTLTLTNDYIVDGISQSDSKPALQITSRYNHESGAYAEFWASNVDFGPSTNANVELDYTLGYVKPLAERLSLDIGVAYYQYLGNHTYSLDFAEIYAGVIVDEYTSVSFFIGKDEALNGQAHRFKVLHEIPLTLSSKLGLETTYVDEKGSNIEWLHYKIGIINSFQNIELEMNYQNTTIDHRLDPQGRADGRFSLIIRLTN